MSYLELYLNPGFNPRTFCNGFMFNIVTLDRFLFRCLVFLFQSPINRCSDSCVSAPATHNRPDLSVKDCYIISYLLLHRCSVTCQGSEKRNFQLRIVGCVCCYLQTAGLYVKHVGCIRVFLWNTSDQILWTVSSLYNNNMKIRKKKLILLCVSSSPCP